MLSDEWKRESGVVSTEWSTHLWNPFCLLKEIQRHTMKFLNLPMMTLKEIKEIINVLESYSNPRCLEWGSGYSTALFSQHIGNGYWIAIEHSPVWYEEVVRIVGERAKVVLIPKEEVPEARGCDQSVWYERIARLFGEKMGIVLLQKKGVSIDSTHMDAYTQKPFEINPQYDFILVDGLYRSECIIAASHSLSRDGSIVLHDACREEYRSVISLFETVIPHFNVGEKCPDLLVLRDPKPP